MSDIIKNHDTEANIIIPQLKGHILLAEDNPDIQQLIAFHIRKTGAQITIAENGASALEQGLQNHYDLILMSMQMPIMDGIESTRQLRRQGCNTPIVALTANATTNDIANCRAAGSNDFLTKPIKWKDFFSTLDMHLQTLDKNHSEIIPLAPILDDDEDEDEDYILLIRRFVDQLPARLESINDNYLTQDWQGLAACLHDLKGMGGGFGYPSLTELAGTLEFSLKKQDYHELPEGLDQLAKLVDRINQWQ